MLAPQNNFNTKISRKIISYICITMLILKGNCEHCSKELPADSREAMICSFECTFCATCVTDILKNCCPNCGGNFEKRPIRPLELLIKYPAGIKK